MLIAIGGCAGAGKSTAADALIAQGFVRLKLAGPLKDMLRVIGLSEVEIEGTLKGKPSAKLCGRTPRYAMQTLGTDWGRKTIGEEFWTQMFERKAEVLLTHGLKIVCDDLRFPNEFAPVRKLGGHIIKIERPSLAVPPWWKRPFEHPSEKYARKMSADRVIVNDGTIRELQTRIEEEVACLIG